jgi:hypothetical protein
MICDLPDCDMPKPHHHDTLAEAVATPTPATPEPGADDRGHIHAGGWSCALCIKQIARLKAANANLRAQAAIAPPEPGAAAGAAPEQRIAALEAALNAIIDFQPEYFDHAPEVWAQHTPETCAKCAEWEARRHPLQRRCDEWYRLHRRRDAINDDRAAAVAATLREIARAALTEQP